jgi:hypothetical protein
MDIAGRVRETDGMLKPGSSRERLAGILKVGFAQGLLSEQTLSHRLGLLFGPRLIEPSRVIGDLAFRSSRRSSGSAALAAARLAVRRVIDEITSREDPEPAPLLLALDWSGAHEDLLIGRAPACDIAPSNMTVSRRHARLLFRDGTWIVNDLASKNGLTLNGTPVGRCQLRPGDRLALGLQLLEID